MSCFPHLTLIYARIANRAAEDEYLNVTERSKLYQRPDRFPAHAEDETVRRLRTETERRLLGNGWSPRCEVD